MSKEKTFEERFDEEFGRGGFGTTKIFNEVKRFHRKEILSVISEFEVEGLINEMAKEGLFVGASEMVEALGIVDNKVTELRKRYGNRN